MSAVHNEQTKLLANALDNIGVALIVIGVVTPITAIGFEVPTTPPFKPITALFGCIWLSAGLGLHGLARRALRSLKL